MKTAFYIDNRPGQKKGGIGHGIVGYDERKIAAVPEDFGRF